MEQILETVWNFLAESWIAIAVSVPLSFLIFLLMHKYKHKILVNLGDHKWVIK